MFNINNRVITMSRDSLLTALRKNREKHISELEEAKVDYLKCIEADLKAALKLVKKGDFEVAKKIRVVPQVPTSHVHEYDEAIQMLEYSQSETIEIDNVTFSAYVNNNWYWTKEFKTVSSLYKLSGTTIT